MLNHTITRLLKNRLLWVGLAYALGIGIRAVYCFAIRPSERYIDSDMEFYIQLARTLQSTRLASLQPWHVTHPLGFPLTLAWILPSSGGYLRATLLQFVVSCLVPLVVGLLGAAAFGKKIAPTCVVLASLYFPFIEYGALYLTEVHFIFWMAIGFAALLMTLATTSRTRLVLFAVAGGFCLSVALTMKALALPAGLAFFATYGVRQYLEGGKSARSKHFRSWLVVSFAACLGALPLTAAHTAVCTHANRGNFCVAGNKSAADFLLGHTGPVHLVRWASEEEHHFQFGSPGAYLRRYSRELDVPFRVYDSTANSRAAWQWIARYPGEALVLSLNHVYDAFFGTGMWPSFQTGMWPWTNLFQLLFVAFLLFPTAVALVRQCHFSWRNFLCSRTLLVFSPVLGLLLTLLVATGEVRYRVPFDIFFMVIASAHWAGRLLASDAPESMR